MTNELAPKEASMVDVIKNDEEAAEEIVREFEHQMDNYLPAKGENSSLCAARRLKQIATDVLARHRLASAPKWLLIEDVPEDEVVDVWSDSTSHLGRNVNCEWSKYHKVWLPSGSSGSGVDRIYNVTHYMLPPTPPEGE